VGCATLVELEAAIRVLVDLFQTCADELLKVGAGVAVDLEAQASIVACLSAIITVSTSQNPRALETEAYAVHSSL
jgi:hypothetical protein